MPRVTGGTLASVHTGSRCSADPSSKVLACLGTALSVRDAMLVALTVKWPNFAWVWDQECAKVSTALHFQVIVKRTMEGSEYFSDITEGELGGGLPEWQHGHS